MNKKEFYFQLEGLRGIAILFVIISHFLINPYFPNLIFLKLGAWGVNLFFVLSGFLITEILIKEVATRKSSDKILKGFYLKRVLRIFPIYYLTLFILAIFEIDETRTILPYTLTYTYNIGRIWMNLKSGVLMHFWSLCVEEQFYLIWPIILIVSRPQKQIYIIVGLIIFSVLIKVIYFSVKGYNYLDFNLAFTPCSFDALGFGALLAFLKLNNISFLKKILKYYFLPILFIFIFYWSTIRSGESSLFYQGFSRLIFGITGFFLVGLGALSRATHYGTFMSNRYLRFLGRISYGLYVYHWIFFYLLKDYFSEIWDKIDFGSLPILKYHSYAFSFLFFFIITILISSFSYYFIEKPLLKYKNSFKFAF